MQPAGQPEQTGYSEYPNSRVLRMLACKLPYDMNDLRALIGLSPCDVTFMSDLRPLVLPGLHNSVYSNWSLAAYPLFYSSKLFDSEIAPSSFNPLKMTCYRYHHAHKVLMVEILLLCCYMYLYHVDR